MDNEEIKKSMAMLYSSSKSLSEMNALLMAEVQVLRAFCLAMAQSMSQDRQHVYKAFTMLCATFRPDETAQATAAARFDAISQLLSAGLTAAPGSLPPSPLSSVPPTS